MWKSCVVPRHNFALIFRVFVASRPTHTHTHDRNGRKRDVQPTHRNVARGTINRGTAISSIRFARVTNSPSPLPSRDTLSGPRIFYKSRFRDRFIAPPLTRYTRVETLEERAKHRVPLFVLRKFVRFVRRNEYATILKYK